LPDVSAPFIKFSGDLMTVFNDNREELDHYETMMGPGGWRSRSIY